jgi:hypothetical protein
MKIDAAGSLETSVAIQAARYHILENKDLHSHRRKDVKSHLRSLGPDIFISLWTVEARKIRGYTASRLHLVLQ